MSAGGVERTLSVLDDIVAERGRQVAKWGDQSSIADAEPVILSRLGKHAGTMHGSPADVAESLAGQYGVPRAARARYICQQETERHGGTWAGVLIEEVAEAIEAVALAADADHHDFPDPPRELRAELVQVAAVAVAWIEALDRRGVKATPQRAAG